MDGEEQKTSEQTTEQTDAPIHTDAEARLTQEVAELKKMISDLKAENQKLFLRLGGDGQHQTEKSPDDEIREMLKKFQSSGYDPGTLYDGR